MTPLLELDSVSVDYGRGPVLREVSLAVASGDILGLVGESGCGKTTLGLSILGLLPEYATMRGRILF
jgi:ABC-type glutathione transport system ATPase component